MLDELTLIAGADVSSVEVSHPNRKAFRAGFTMFRWRTLN
jgi:hypothetical protein